VARAAGAWREQRARGAAVRVAAHVLRAPASPAGARVLPAPPVRTGRAAGYDPRVSAGEPPQSAGKRREALKRVYAQAQACSRCPELASTRNSVVFGAGNADADLMFVGEAPGKSEDEQGVPFVGQAGKLLEKLLGEIGITRTDVFIANTLKCRPPGNRDPQPIELENCRDYLDSQLQLIRPKVVCTLGNFATKLLREDKTGITRLHGQAELRTIGPRVVRLYPIFHPAAALYTPRMLQTLREDFMRLPELLAMPEPEQPEQIEVPEPEIEQQPEPQDAGARSGGGSSGVPAGDGPAESEADQLGLF